MPSSATKQKISEILAEAADPKKQAAVQGKTKTETANDEKFANIASNPFYAIFANTETSPSQKQAEVAKLATATDDKEKNRAAKAAYEQFMAWMQEKRQSWALKMISLVDTQVFSELKKFYANMNNGVLEFNESLKDLTDILEGLDELRLEGKTLDAFAEIKKDKEEEARRAQIRKEQEDKANKLLGDKEAAEREIASLQQNTHWYLGGKVDKASRQAIAQRQIDVQKTEADIAALATERENTEAEFAKAPTSGLDEKLATAKNKLRELLELSDEEHQGRQQRLVEAAKNFVLNTKADTASALEHLDGLGDQYQKLQDNAKNMRATVLIVNEGMKDAGKASREIYDGLNPPADAASEGEIARMEREDKQAAIRDHITAIELTAGDRVSMLKDLTELNSQSNSMRETNEQEMQKVRTMNLNGVSGMAERLVTVLNGVDSAALHQGAEMTQNSLDTMNRSTHDLLTKGVVAHAVGMLEDNDRLSQSIAELEELSKKTRQATAVTAQALSEGAKIRADNEQKVAQLKQDMEDYLKQAAVMRDGAAAQIATSVPGTPAAANKAPKPLFGD